MSAAPTGPGSGILKLAVLGEDNAKVLRFSSMSVPACSVTLTDSRGVRHTVDVTAESLFEAAAQALVVFKRDGWTDPVGPSAKLEVEVRAPAVRHAVTMLQIQRWLSGATSSPNERVRKERMKALLR